MKIKKEALGAKPAGLGGCEERLHNGLTNETDHNVMSEIVANKSLLVLSDSSTNPDNLPETLVDTLRIPSTESSTTEPWHHSGILHQALLQINSSKPIEEPTSNNSKDSVLPKVTGPLLPTVGELKISEGLPSASESLPDTHVTFSADRSYSAPIISLPPVTSPFGSLPFATLTSDCTQVTPSTLPLMTQLQACDIVQSGLAGAQSNHPSVLSTNSVSNRSGRSSASVTASDISTSLVPVPHLCQAIASLSSKDEAVTVVYSSFPKVEPSGSHLIHNNQKTVPLPSMSEMKSSLSNHLNSIPQTQRKLDSSNLCNKVSDPLPSISSSKSNSHSETLGFNNIPATVVEDAIATIKLDGSPDRSEFGSNSTLSLPSGPLKFPSDNSSSDLGSSIVIPVSSDVILTKIDGQSSASSQDISHIITIPLPTGTVYNSSLIPMSLPLCNGNTPGGSSQMTSAVVANMPYSITGISSHGSDTCWPTSGVALSVTSSTHQTTPVSTNLPVTTNTHQTTSVTTSLPVSVMSVTSTVPSVQASNMIHLTSNTASIPAPSLTTSTVISTVTQDPICYTVQSPAEILSQLSKAGALPTMSSSQVSSVLSALGSDAAVDMESDSAHHSEMLNSQVLHVDKVSTLTQTDALEINMMQTDEKIIQLLGEQQLLEQVNGSQVMGPSGSSPLSQSQPISAGTPLVASTISHSDIIPASVPEPKQAPAPYPRIVAMVLNTSIMGSDKLSDVQRLQGTMFKDGELRITNNIVEPHSEQLSENCHMLRNYLVVPNNAKPQRKRSKRTSALREMLLGLSESVADKESLSKKSRGRPKKSKSEREVKTVASNLEVHWNGSSLTSGFTREAECYKCVYCPFISLDENNMVVHVKLKHSSEVSDVSVVRQELKCPGCQNVFFTTNSLEVHLKQDHQVHAPELKAITSSAIKTAAEGKMKLGQQNHKKKKNSGRRKLLCNSELKTDVVNSSSTSCLPEILADRADNMSVMDIARTIMINTHDASEVTLNECSQVEVKNLNDQVELSKGETCSVNESSTNEGSLNTCGLKATQDTLQVKLATPNDTLLVAPGKSQSSVSGKPEQQKRKRGRPKGSKSTMLGTAVRGGSKDDRNAKKPGGYRCNINNCAVTMRSPENIEYHRSCHSGAEFHCPECPHTHCHWDGMSIHLWRSHTVDMELYTCDQCNYKTNSYAKLINLHKWIHGSERPFLCDSCGKGFKNRKQLRNHKAVHQPKQTEVGECEVCGRAFTNKRLLRMHLDNVHNKLRPHLCNYCGYSASSVSSLKMHMRKHTGEKPFRCQLCDYCTADHNSLRRHKMRHTGDKPYKCPHCPYACIQSSTYKAHLKTKHPGMDDGLMFSCNLCSFRSVKEENYIAHLSEHKHPFTRGSDQLADAEKQATTGADRTAKQIKERPVILNISSQMPLLSNSAATDEEHFNLEGQSESVIHLVVSNESSEHFSVVKLDSMDSTSDVQMSLESDFEGEVITGDLPGDLPSEAELITGDLNEPQEFKVCASELKMKSLPEANAL